MSKNPVHIYRALLRECTYLPDPNSRAYIKHWVHESFRRYLPRDLHLPRCRPVPVDHNRESKNLKKGRHLAETLRRANQGYPAPFEKVLRWTYARLGKRRRVLMSGMTSLESNGIEGELEELEPQTPIKFSKDWKPSPTILALMSSQEKQYNHLPWINARISSKRPNPQEKNIWGKSMPECRFRNKQRKWYAINLDLMLLPLPDAEYNHIKACATGETRVEPRLRRITASVHLQPSEKAEESVLEEPKMSQHIAGRPHEMTQRFFRRHYQRLLLHVPYAQELANSPERPLAIKWDRVYRERFTITETNDAQSKALFG